MEYAKGRRSLYEAERGQQMAAAVRSFGLQRYDDEKIGADEATVNALPESALQLLRHRTAYSTLPGGKSLNYPVYVKVVSLWEAEKADRCGRERIGPPVYRVSTVRSYMQKLPKYQIVMLKLDADAIEILSSESVSEARILTAMYRAAERVAKLHRDTFHGDMKGDNVGISLHKADSTGAEDDVVLLDFARKKFTTEYSSPEILRCQQGFASRHTREDTLKKGDVYALGIMLITHISRRHILLSHASPHSDAFLNETIAMRLERPTIEAEIRRVLPKDCSCQDDLIPLLVRTLSPNPDERQTARELAATLFTLLPAGTQERMRERGFAPMSDEDASRAPDEETGAAAASGSTPAEAAACASASP